MAIASSYSGDVVWLLVVKGNLRHRIALLGTELGDEDRSTSQRRLAAVAKAVDWQEEDSEYRLGRPWWANGAFVFLSQEHARIIQGALVEKDIGLQSKHILVSGAFKAAVHEALEGTPQGPGREAFLMRRASATDSQDIVLRAADVDALYKSGATEVRIPRPSPTATPKRTSAGRQGAAGSCRKQAQAMVPEEGGESVWLLVAKGNLRHRIALMGIELTDAERSPAQERLAEAARAVDWKEEDRGQRLGRPWWANGAFVFLTQEHARVIREALDTQKIDLQSKHILISGVYKKAVHDALGAKPSMPGREAFLMRRAGAIDSQEIVPLPPVSAEPVYASQQEPPAQQPRELIAPNPVSAVSAVSAMGTMGTVGTSGALFSRTLLAASKAKLAVHLAAEDCF